MGKEGDKVKDVGPGGDLEEENGSSRMALEQDEDSAGGPEGECKGAAEILPEEVWRIIFAQLTDPKDLWSASKTCQLFHRMLHRSKTTFLFSQVLPHLFQHLPRTSALKCRAVCKEWNGAIDDFLGDHPSNRPHDDNTYDARRRTFVNPMREKVIGEYNYIFNVGLDESHSRNLQNPAFLELAQDGLRNPLIGRAIEVWFDHAESEEEEDCFAGLYKLLETSGKHIWYLKVNLLGIPAPENAIPEKMQIFLTADLFRLVPNLRCLRLFGCVSEWPMPVIDSLPHAPSLETLEFLDKSLETDARHQSGQLRRLYLQSGNWEWRKKLFRSQFHWPNLVELHVEGMFLAEFVPFFRDLKMPQLKKLGVINKKWPWIFYLKEDDGRAPIDAVLDMVFSGGSHWSGISTLLIQGKVISHPVNFEEEKRTFLRRLTMHSKSPNEFIPPTLKSLELGYSPGTCHSFLRRFPFLENLNFVCGNLEDIWALDERWYEGIQGQPRMERELVEVNKYLLDAKIYKSNIWEELPRLKVLTFLKDVFTREGYEKYSQFKKDSQDVELDTSDSDSSVSSSVSDSD